MEQVTQAILGGVAAQALCTRVLGRRAWIVGAVAGVLPDLDLFLEPLADPRFPIELHRTWTHALAVTPLGALVTLLLFLPFAGFRTRRRAVYVAALVGWLTHAPLDACTSYGTKLWLPFSDAWVAWDLISIVDPLFSVILLVGLVGAVRRSSSRPAVVALCLALLYLALGHAQRERAAEAQRELAAMRGHAVEHARAIPVLGSILLWRTLYRADGRVYADAHRLIPFRRPDVQACGSEPVFDPRVVGEDAEDHVVRRFFAFSDGLGVCPRGTDRHAMGIRLVDPRYAFSYGLDGFWGMEIGPAGTVGWFDFRDDLGAGIGLVLAQVFGTEGEWIPRAELRGGSP